MAILPNADPIAAVSVAACSRMFAPEAWAIGEGYLRVFEADNDNGNIDNVFFDPEVE